jgi:uncharacterized protein (DUF1697 family)
VRYHSGGKNKIKMEVKPLPCATTKIFSLLRVSVSGSLMGKDYIGKKLKTPATARNWRTLNKILQF